MARPAVNTAGLSSSTISLAASSSSSSSSVIYHADAGIAEDPEQVGRKKGGGAAGGATEMESSSTTATTTTSKTLSQLRQDAIRTRKDALVAILPARGARLAELFHLLQGRSDPARFGAGLHPPARTGPSGDPAKPLILVQDVELDRNLAEFTERWIRNPNIAPEISLELQPLEPPPPAAPIRRDSHAAAEMSEEVAALERELIKPEYRRSALVSGSASTSNGPTATNGKPESGDVPASSLAPADGPVLDSSEAATTKKEAADGSISPMRVSGPDGNLSAAASSPFPLTFRSPSFLSGRTAELPATVAAPQTAYPDYIDPSQLQFQPKDSSQNSIEPSRPKKENVPFPHLRGYAQSYPPSLPDLPPYLLKNRINVGGLAAQKAKERRTIEQTPTLANTLSSSSDLYKLGISKAHHFPVRSLMGAGAQQPGKTRTGSKVLLTSDWNVAIAELQAQRALERIEHLKAERTWALRQIKKQRLPGTQKAHWDYLLDEMRWMAVDFKQETRWKMASAHELARAVRAWHAASSEEEKAALQVRARQPVLLPPPPLSNEDSQQDTSMQILPDSQEGPAVEEASELASAPSAPSNSDTLASWQTVAPTPQAPSDALPPSSNHLPSSTPAPTSVAARPNSKQSQPVHPRAPVFELPLTSTTFTLSDSDLPTSYRSVSTANVVSELFQDLMCYAPPPDPSETQSSVLNRRIDEASPSYSKITNSSALLESKPLLVSTLHPAKKRKRGDGEWDDLRDVAGDDGRDVLSEMFGPQSEYGAVPHKDTSSKRYHPTPPPNAEARAAAQDWSPEDDQQLLTIARQYSYNWDLVASVFTSSTRRPQGDERLPWDCFDRWHKKLAPPTPSQAGHAQLPNGVAAQAAAAQGGAGTPLSQSTNKKDRRSSSTAFAGPGQGSSVFANPGAPATPSAASPAPLGIVRKPEMSKAYIRHLSIVEATKKVQKRREIQQKQNLPPAIRKVNLTAHETHNQPIHASLTAMDLSRIRWERERVQMEEARKRDQQRMYQQAQAAAMAQQQQIAGRGGLPLQMPMNMQGQANMQRLPPGVNALPQNLQATQAALLQSQRAALQAGQMPLPQFAASLQQNQPRPLGQQQQQQQGQQAQQSQQGSPAPRPNSAQGPGAQQQQQQQQQQQPGMPNGQAHGLSASQSSPLMQHPNLPPGMNMQQQQQQQRSATSPGIPMQQQQQQQIAQLSPPQPMQMPTLPGGQQMSPAQQQAFLAQLAIAGRSGSPMQQLSPQHALQQQQQQQQLNMQQPSPQQQLNNMQQQQQQAMGQLQIPQGMSPEQQQQLMIFLRARQNSQASQSSSQGGQ